MPDGNSNNSTVSANLSRYLPQIRLEEIGEDGQRRLMRSKVLIIGCGALGSVAAAYLAGAGIGRIGIADFDTVEASNLHRQILFTENECGKKKTRNLESHLKALNPDIEVHVYEEFVRESLLESILPDYDFVIDAADNPQTTYLIDRLCVRTSVPYVTAGISGWQGQVFTWKAGATPFSALFPPPEDSEGVLPCSIAGIFGPLAGIVASIQATESIKSILGIDSTLSHSLLVINLLTNSFSRFSI